MGALASAMFRRRWLTLAGIVLLVVTLFLPHGSTRYWLMAAAFLLVVAQTVLNADRGPAGADDPRQLSRQGPDPGGPRPCGRHAGGRRVVVNQEVAYIPGASLVFNVMVEYRSGGADVEDQKLTAVFAALADPTRRAIVRRLASGEATVGELAQPFPISLQAVSKHLHVLEHAGLVDRSRRAQQRPCRLRPEALAEASGWLGDYRRLWETSFDRLDRHLTHQEGTPR